MIIKKYNNIYSKQIKHTNIPLNIITKIFLSRFSPIKKNFTNKKLLDFSRGVRNKFYKKIKKQNESRVSVLEKIINDYLKNHK